jgi:hypothetical protein
MKKLLLFLLIGCAVTAQQKSTGLVTLVDDVKATIILDNATQIATITLSGPEDRWFALKFGSFSSGMQSGPDVVFYDGTTLIDARQTGSGPVADGSQDITIVSSTLTEGIRTFVVTRPFNTGDVNDFVFNFNDVNIDLAGAYGMSSGSYALSFHGPNRALQTDQSFQTLGVEDFGMAKQVVLYPNPARDVLTFEMNIPVYEINIYTHSGKKVKQILNQDIQGNSLSIDVQNFATGIYLIEFKGNQSTSWEKVIIQ